MEQPAISVVVSMYNMQKYIGECLDSLLAQTFQNFEVIVVDDCSTDNSVAIVKSYAAHFGGRLKLASMKKNSGGGGEPRNRGLTYSRGEYVFFMDADDVLISSGLEEMYALAKQFDADTVYCERYFMSSGIGQEFINNVHIADSRTQTIPPVDVPTLETNDMTVRVNKATKRQYWVTPWLRLTARDLLIDNDIKFPSLIGSNDVAWTFKVLFCSKRFLRIPNPCYIRRMHEESTSLRKRTPAQSVHKWMDRTIRSLKDLDDFMAGLDFFKENPDYRYTVVKNFIETDFACIFEYCLDESPFELYSIFREKFGTYLGKHDVLVAGLCTLVNTLQKIYRAEGKYHEMAINSQNFDELNNAIRQDRAYIAELEKFIGQSQQRIAALENEIRRLKGQA